MIKEENSENIGLKLKALRSNKKMSLRALAKNAGITFGALSQIENNKISPSVSTLKKVLNALGLTLGEFFSNPDNDRRDVVYSKNELVNVASGKGLKYMTVPGDSSNRALLVMDETYEPGSGTGAELYTHSGEESGICVEGTIELIVADQRHVLNAGDAFYFNSEEPHSWRNIGDTNARMITACTPPSF